MNAEIIAVGSELLLGQIANTNGQYLSTELAGIGVNVYRHTVVGDNEKRLLASLDEATNRADVVMITGGLGPTQDDLTKEVVSRFIGKPLKYHEKTLENMEQFFKKRQKEMPMNNKKQAHYTEGADVFYNRAGLACGMAIEYKDTFIILLPGPPRELKHMYEHDVKSYILNKLEEDSLVLSRVLRFFSIGESRLEEQLLDLIEAQTNPTIAPLASDGEVTVRMTAKAVNRKEAEGLLDTLESRIRERVGDYIYGKETESLPFQTVRFFQDTGKTLSVAESLTGGWFSKALVDVPGASNIFEGSLTVYSEQAKTDVLRVDSSVIEEFGTVSKECAEQMAERVRQLYSTDIGISFTGVAGPDAVEGKEPGTVWIGIAGPEHVTAHLLNLTGNRDYVRLLAVYYGCWFLLKEKVVNE
ncbi:nicotinamide-nucleotide amidase [Salibacterium salarium]|uniref:competence/damage-inducible protein A n=1 Tax=Salibacterium salarium TaxID=284579 RepID=UPI00277F6BBE|nr:competence/damage-inducible protein A [Salibacterium salarium]MDQ0299200.1 nicotinamide-nucleotide amidase [Salibacterium salarium]